MSLMIEFQEPEWVEIHPPSPPDVSKSTHRRRKSHPPFLPRRFFMLKNR